MTVSILLLIQEGYCFGERFTMALFTERYNDETNYKWGMISIFIGTIAVLLLIAFSMTLKMVSVAPTEIGVKYNKPYVWGSASVEDDTIQVGRHWMFTSSNVVIFPKIPTREDLFFDDLVTLDNNPVDFHLNVSIQIMEKDLKSLYMNFGVNWWKVFVEDPLRTHVREFTKTKSMFQMTTDSTVSRSMQENVKTYLVDFLKENNIPVMVKVVSVGKVLPQQAIIDETIKTGVARQAKRTQIENEQMQIQRKNTEVARAEADKAYMITFDMTAQQYLDFLRIKVQEQAVANGASVSLIMGNAQPMIDVSPTKQ